MEEEIFMLRTRPVSGPMFMPNTKFIMIAIAILVILCILYIPVMVKLNKKGVTITRQLSYLALFSSVYLIAFATILFVPIVNLFTPLTFKLGSYLNLIPFGWLREPDVKRQIIDEVIPNMVLFFPLGIFIPVVFREMRKISKVFLVVFFISFSIEVFQYFLGRSADVDDIIKNTIGGIVGYGFFIVFNRLFYCKIWWNKFNGNYVC